MVDEPFYAPNAKPRPPRQPKRGERVFILRKDGWLLECELKDQGQWGVEVQLFNRGSFLGGRRFDTKALALQWAELERVALIQDGWAAIEPSSPSG